MHWGKVEVDQQRQLFITQYLSNKFNLAELCRQFEISRKCGYKWIKRFEESSWEGLKERSRAPLTRPGATSPELVDAILRLKCSESQWGPKKILGNLKKHFPDTDWPSLTTTENILKRNGLVKKRSLRKRLAVRQNPLENSEASNGLWCMDLKGCSQTSDQMKFEPFTVTDDFSRYLLCCQQLQSNNTMHVWGILERLFREYGLPLRIRSDNGPPFATVGAGRLSRLSIKLIKAGVIPEWIDPGEPQQNGRHERMHQTLKREGIDVLMSLDRQIKKLEEFTEYYNFVRPHEALGQNCPADIYYPSPRYWDGRLRTPEYPDGYDVGRVMSCGKMSWKNRNIYVGRVFEGELIGLAYEEEIVKAYYGPIYLGIVGENNLEFERRPPRKKVKIKINNSPPMGGDVANNGLS